MKNEDIYKWMEKHDVPEIMVSLNNGNLYPVYNGDVMVGKQLVNSVDKPEERIRLKIISDLEKLSIKYEIERGILKKSTSKVDIYLPKLNRAFEVKPFDLFDNPLYVEQDLFDYNTFCDTLLLTYCENTKMYITKNKQGEKKYYKKMNEILYKHFITESDLVNITNDAVPTIINNMLETLYSNNVSDYTKGLDVIVKLLACKNIDEKDYHEDGILKLQIIDNEPDSVFIDKIVDLYLKSAKELNNQVDENYMCSKTSFYLIEVDDEITYNKNTKILKQLVGHIQRYKFVKVGNVDFITRLFEQLENNKTLKDYGIYITDSNMTKFITESLPIKEYIENTKNPKLRYQDPAVGTGHFPNSFINEYSSVVRELCENNFRASNKDYNEFLNNYHNIDSVKREYIMNFISGIDVQKRNIELCRINTTLKNGEQIKCYHGNTLQKSMLRKKYPNSSDFMDEKMDFITSNYPFSVKSFTKDLNPSDVELFNLCKYTTDKSQQIENLFLEDTIQKLKEGGIAGFVIFESVLWKNLAINNELRYKMLVECELISIVKLGSEAFKNTSTKSVVLFLRKRNKSDIEKVKIEITNFLKSHQKIEYNGINVIEKYADENYGMSFIDYIEFLVKNNKNSKEHRDLIKKETQNLNLYLINYNHQLLYADLSFDSFNDDLLTKKQNQEIRKKKQRKILGISKSSYDEKKYENSEYLPTLSNMIKNFYLKNINSVTVESEIEKVFKLNDIVNFEIDGGYVISVDGDSNDYLTENFGEKEFINLSSVVQFHEKTKHRADDGIIGGQYPFYTCTSDDDVYKTTNEPDREGEYILINNGGESFFRLTNNNSKWSASGDVIIMSSNHPILTNKYIAKFLKNNPKVLEITYKGSGLKHSSIGRLKKIMIPNLNYNEMLDYINN
jgi:type I restriction enzyme M protein